MTETERGYGARWDEHPAVAPDEWDGRHIDYTAQTCRFCGAGIEYLGDYHGGSIRCSASGTTLWLR